MKYIVLTILLLITLILFGTYEDKFSEAEKLNDFFQDNKFLKDSLSFDSNQNYSFTGNYEMALSGLDLGTVRLLDQNLSGALELFLEKEVMTYKDYFNKGNILLRLGVKYFNKDDTKSLEYLLGAISSYSTVTGNLETDAKIKNASFENLSIAMNLRNLLEIKSYIIFLAELIKKTDSVLSEIKDLKIFMIKQIQSLQKLEKTLKDDSLKQCLNDLKKEMVDNYNGLGDNELFFGQIRNNLFKSLERIQNRQTVNKKYMEKKEELERMFQGSLDTMLGYFKEIHEGQGKLYDIIESKDINKLRDLCKEQESKSKDDENVKDAYQNLSELLDKQQQEQQKEERQQSQDYGTNEYIHENMTEEEMERKSESLERKNKKWIEKIEERKNSSNYNPSELLDELFESFLGENKDFYDRETPNYDGTIPRNW